MSVTINASTTSGLVMTSDLSGTLSLQSNGVAVTMPAVAGTMMVSGNMPAFSAYATAATTITNATWTKLTFDVETFDTNNNFASSRFTPTVAGYYQLSASWQAGFTSSFGGIQIYKNGSSYQYGSFIPATSVGTQVGMSNLVYCNGTTDYVEVYAYQTTGLSQNTTVTGINTTWFSGAMVRTA